MTPLPEIAPRRENFPDAETLAEALATKVATALTEGIKARGRASILLSGGSTPKRFFAALSRRPLDWSNVGVSLVDERWVPPTSDRSNGALVKENLLAGPAAAATLVPLYVRAENIEDGLRQVTKNLGNLPRPFDAVILGMGNDGHTASFFPGGDNLTAALDPATQGELIPMRAPGAGEPRVTFTLARLLETRNLILHIQGQEKADTLKRALGSGAVSDMPVRAVLRQTDPAPVIYWCP
ncbi:MAG: 6-phosphogluconolactonase [Alphaproteobacteria bacterium]|nr:6-phosphogluconolactonase [Alphaproteobacteria bacterium]